jgi:hypothetical protein
LERAGVLAVTLLRVEISPASFPFFCCDARGFFTLGLCSIEMTLGIKDILYPRMAKRKSLISTSGNVYLRMEATPRNRGEPFND